MATIPVHQLWVCVQLLDTAYGLVGDIWLTVCVQEREDVNLSDWDRFARTEYIRLAMEEEGEDGEPESSTDLWENSVTEPPF